MGEQIWAQCRLLLDGLCLGLALGGGYDIFRLRRKIFPGGTLWMGIEDFLYCIASGLLMFGLFYRDNSGVIRWFALASAGGGIWIYRKGPSRFLLPAGVFFCEKFLKYPLVLLSKGLKFLLKSTRIKFNRKKQCRTGGRE